MANRYFFYCRKVGAIGTFHIVKSIDANTLEDAWAEWDRQGLSDHYERCGVSCYPLKGK